MRGKREKGKLGIYEYYNIHRTTFTIILLIFLSSIVTCLSDEHSVNDSASAVLLNNNLKKIDELNDSLLQNIRSEEISQSDQSKPSQKIPDLPAAETVLKNIAFGEALSQNSGLSNGLAETGQPVLVTLVDTAAAELTETIQNANAVNSIKVVNNLSQFKDHTNKTPVVIQLPVKDDDKDNGKNQSEPTEGSLPRDDNYTLTEKVKTLDNDTIIKEDDSNATIVSEVVKTENDTLVDEPLLIDAKKTAQEEIPSFSEWTQKQLEEAEKNKENGLNLSAPSVTGTITSPINIKVRSKNYASPDCGAKIVATNPEAGSASAILNPNRDEYMLNTCNSRIWFIVELCEAIQAKKIDIANFELFSSTPRNFSVSVGDRFPTREWASVGQFIANDERDVQTFNLQPHLFGKFIRVELHSYHGSEHYCPISLFRVYGTSEFEVFETENNPHSQDTHESINEDDDILEDIISDFKRTQDAANNLFGSARDAVMSIMKKAAQVLVKSGDSNNTTSNTEFLENIHERCVTPSHIIVCDSCSNALFSNVFEVMSCRSDFLNILLKSPSVYNAFHNTDACQHYGLDFKSTQTSIHDMKLASYMSAFLTPTYIVALCNMLAIVEKKVVLNTSYETDLNITSNLTIDKKLQSIQSEEDIMKNIVQVDSNKNKLPSADRLQPKPDSHIEEKINVNNIPLNEETLEENQINPTKTANDKTILTETNVILTTPYENPTITKDTIQHTRESNQSEIEGDVNIETSSSTPIIADANTQPLEIESSPVLNIDTSETQEVNNKNGDSVINSTAAENSNNIVNSTDVTIDDSNIKIYSPELDSLLSEFEQVNNDAGTPAPTQNIVSQTPQGQKESVFLRLSNRIKSLERNMSLSSQYLEELSRRYKKQVEEMQKTFDKTLLIMKEESKRSEDREHKNKEEMLILQQQLAELSSAVSILLSEKNTWLGTFSLMLIFQVVIICLIFYLYRKANSAEDIPERRVVIKDEKIRRNSIDCKPTLINASKNSRRRSSDEALQIVRSAEVSNSLSVKSEKKKRRRKSSTLHRSYSIATPSEVIDLTDSPSETAEIIRPEDGRPITDTPFVLEEPEFIIPEGQPLNLDQMDDKFVSNGISPKRETASKINEKFRRLSSPAFLRGNINRQSSISGSSIDAKSSPSNSISTPLKMFIKQEIKSEEKADRSGSESPQLSICSSFGDISETVSSTQSEDKKFNKRPKGKSFKNIFKNVLNK